mgnify:CR=1 FL=1|jgi:hypothetical protein
MPLRNIGTDLSPLVFDDDYEIIDEKKLAEYIGEIILGYYLHVKKIIDQLDSGSGPTNEESIQAAIKLLNSTDSQKLKGFLFQHMSWIALAMQYKTTNLKMVRPHDAPAQQGIDGLAILLCDDGLIDKIIITEDKCSKEPRKRIQSEVYPEFDDFESGKSNNKIVSGITSLVGYDENLLKKIEPNIVNKSLWQYRIGVTRNDNYQTPNDRKALFNDYDKHVFGSQERRHAATIYIPDTDNWSENLKDKIIQYLNSRK